MESHIAAVGPARIDAVARTPVQEVARRRVRVSLSIALLLLLIFGGGMLAGAFWKPLMVYQVVPGISVVFFLFLFVFVSALLATWTYVWWAEHVYDPACTRARDGGRGA